MKKSILFFAALLFAFSLMSQDNFMQRIPAYPKTVSADEVNKFLQQLSALKEEIGKKVDVYNTENQAALSKIDPAAVANAYQDMALIQKLQESQQKNTEYQALLMKKQAKIAAYLDSLNLIYRKDFDVFLVKHNEYMSRCSGEVGSGNNCDALLTDLTNAGNKVLMKYWFSDNAEYKKYLAFVRNELEKISIESSILALESGEIGGVVIPHKKDYAEAAFAVDYIKFIEDAFTIDSRLWPMK